MRSNISVKEKKKKNHFNLFSIVKIFFLSDQRHDKDEMKYRILFW